MQRADPLAAAVEAGSVVLVRGAWNDAFVNEPRSFPHGAHDDQADAAADGFAWLARRSWTRQVEIAAPVQVAAGPQEYGPAPDLRAVYGAGWAGRGAGSGGGMLG